MRRRRALALAVVLVVVCLVPIAPRSLGPFNSISVLAQEADEQETGAPTDLAIVALHCAEAPAAEALTSYFATGAPPEACAPAVGVAIIVSEDQAALPDSPFRTDVAGSLVVPVGLGSQVEVAEDPDSLPDGYEPLIGEANSVPYANPVRLDAAVAGAAVLFVNVPASVAALAQEAGAAVDLEDAASPAVDAVAEGNECDLAAPTARDATVLDSLPVPRALGANTTRTGIGSAPISTDGAPSDVAASGVSPRGAIAGGNSVAVVSNPVRTGAGIWGWQGSHRSDNRLWRFEGFRADDWREHGKGLWIWPGDHSSDARSLVFSGSSVHIADGVWHWPSHGRADDWRDHDNDSWTWGDDRDRDHDWRMNDRGVWVRSGAFASSGNGSVAVSAHSVRIGSGIWFWPRDRNRADDWRWRARNQFDDWFVHGNGVWLRPGRIAIDNLTAARSGNGSLAIVASAVRIGHGVWLLPVGHVGHGVGVWAGSAAGDDWLRPRHTDSGIWVLSTAIARSSSGALAISSHAVRIDAGIWLLPTDRDRSHDWLGHGGDARLDESSLEPQAVDGNLAVASPPGKVEPTTSTEQPAPTSDDGLTVAAPPADAIDLPSGDLGQPAVETAPPIDSGNAVASSDEPVAAPLDVAVAASSDVDAGDVAPAVEPAPTSVEPAFADPGDGSLGYVEPSFPEPAVDAGFVEPAVDPGFGDPGAGSPASFAPDAGIDAVIAAPPGNSAPDLGFANSGSDPGFAAPDPVAVAPSGGGPALGDPGSAAPDIGLDTPGNSGPDNLAPINVAPDADIGPSGVDAEDE